jgi:MYXO-CTERM domain-containing protein
VGGPSPGGVASFAGATACTTPQISAQDPGGSPVAPAIDDLRLDASPIPEPGPAAPLAHGAGVLGALAARRRRRAPRSA